MFMLEGGGLVTELQCTLFNDHCSSMFINGYLFVDANDQPWLLSKLKNRMRTEMRTLVRLFEPEPVVLAGIAELVCFRRMKREQGFPFIVDPQRFHIPVEENRLK